MNTAPAAERPWIVRLLAQTARDLGYLIPLLPIAVATFAASTTAVATSISLVIVWVGVPLGIATLWMARGFAVLERVRLGWLGKGAIIGDYKPLDPNASTWAKAFHAFTDLQMWKDLLHSLVTFPVAVASWTITAVWLGIAGTGLTGWAWDGWIDTGSGTDNAFLNWLESLGGQLTLGTLALLTLPWIVRGLAIMHRAIGRGLLGTDEESRLRDRVSRLETQRGAAATAEADALRRIERDLHDGPQQQLIRLQMDAQLAERKVEEDPEAAREALRGIRAQSAEILAELRALTRGFAPPLLAERGLAAAIESLADRSTVPVSVEVEAPAGLGAAAETAAYFVVSEGLANVAKHAGASAAAVRVLAEGQELIASVADDGRGGASIAKGHGLAGLAERVEGAGGTLTVDDAPAGGTVLVARLPLA
ncbi:sensor histidine kinase [Demequina pelophila]|uniref:sensor histidine kinase n=1 Tax=Demequina pelophila TaxID=1638984 RepID=UPI0007859547|nr:sensor histidine kinase [Demequina pelophila]